MNNKRPLYIVLGAIEYQYGEKSTLSDVHRHKTPESARIEQLFLIKRYPSEHFTIFEEVEKEDGKTVYNEIPTPPYHPFELEDIMWYDEY